MSFVSPAYALLLDFDGTLVDIAERPDAVQVEEDLPSILVDRRDDLGGALAIVTGRRVDEIDHYLRIRSLDVCGMHGLERRIGRHMTRPDGLADLVGEAEALRQAFAGRPGVVVENKKVGVALHWRMEPEAEDEAKAAMERLAARLGPGYRVQDGKAVRELVPAGAGKDGAVRALMEVEPYRRRIPIFVGDDRTDEHGFAAVAEFGGIAVKLGEGPTEASRRLPGAAAFRAWLRSWDGGPAGLEALPPA